MSRATIVGHAVDGFGGEIHESPEELVSRLSIGLMDKLGISRADLDAVVLSDQDAFDGTAISSGIKVTPAGGYEKPTMRVQNCCGYGIHQAVAKIECGKADLVAVVGADTVEADPVGVSHISQEAIYTRDAGQNHLMSFGLLTNHFLAKTDTADEDLAAVAAANYKRAAGHAFSHRTAGYSADEVLTSDRITSDLRELMVSPLSYGAAVLYLASTEKAAELDVDPVRLTGYGAGSSRYQYRDMDDLLSQPSLARASREAYDSAGIDDPRSAIDLVETYCPSPTHELLTYATLGLTDRIDDVEFALSGETDDGPIARNPSGGALATNPPNSGGILRTIHAARCLSGELETAVPDPKTAVVADNDLFLGDQGVTDAVLVLEGGVAT